MSDAVTRARDLLAEATPGPWEADELEGNLNSASGRVAEVLSWSDADAELIAAAPALLAELVDEVERLRATPKPSMSAAITRLAEYAHASATERGIYPQPISDSLRDIEDELSEAQEELSSLRGPIPPADPDDLARELADVALSALTTLHDMGYNAGDVLMAKHTANTLRGPRRNHRREA